MFTSIFLVTLILIIWFQTEAFVEYCNLFNIQQLFFIGEFVTFKQEGGSLTYPEFLLERTNNSFIAKLVSCPICLSVWLGLITSMFTTLLYFPIITVSSLILYYITILLSPSA